VSEPLFSRKPNLVHDLQGVVTETYYPTVDRPQLRDLHYLITDGESFFHEEKRHLKTNVKRSSSHALAFA